MSVFQINRGIVKAGFLPTYGAGQVTNSALIARPWTVTMKPIVTSIATNGFRQGSRELSTDYLSGNLSGLVTIEGSIAIQDTLLLKAAFLSSALDGTAGKLYMLYDEQGWDGTNYTAPYSLAIYKSNPSSGSNVYDYAKGCVCSGLNISGGNDDVVKFSATFRSQKPVFGATVTFTGSLPTKVVDYCKFGECTFSDGTGTSMSNFSIDITHLFAADLVLWGNRTTKGLDVLLKNTVMSSVTRYKQGYMSLYDNLIMSDTLQSLTFGLTNSAGAWSIQTYGKVETSLNSDSPNDIIMQTLGIHGLWDVTTTEYAIEVTVS